MILEGRIRSLCAQVALETNSDTFEALVAELTLLLMILRTPATESAGAFLTNTVTGDHVKPD